MQRILNWLRRAFRANPTPARPRAVRPQLERLDDRLVPSVSSAITTHHFAGYSSWTQHDFYTIDQGTGQVVDFQTSPWGHSRTVLGGPQKVSQVSATVDPSNGSAEVFALDGDGGLWLLGSGGTRKNLGGPGVGSGGVGYNKISATRDGHVYTDQGGGDIQYVDSNGNATDLGRPVASGYSGAQEISAGTGWFGQNEVFAVGNDGHVYVNSTGYSWGWRLVDNSANFTAVAATTSDQVFALDSAGKMHLESEHRGWYFNGSYGTIYYYWSGQDVSAGMTFNAATHGTYYPEIYADTDASGQAEVYALSGSNQGLYRYDQGTWREVDSYVWNAATADGGYFFDVNVGGYAWANDPSSGWTPLGNNVE